MRDMWTKETALRDFVAGYKTIVLIANSEALDLAAVTAAMPDDALYVFFGNVRKVMTEPFRKPSLLCHRIAKEGRLNHLQADIDRNIALFPDGALLGRAGIYAQIYDRREMPKRDESFFDVDLPYLMNCDPLLNPWYTLARTPTTGAAVALWFAAHVPDSTIFTAGFTGERGTDLKMLNVHNWTLDQAALRLHYRKGTLQRFEDRERDDDMTDEEGLAIAFPEMSREEIGAVYRGVTRDQVKSLDRMIGLMWPSVRRLDVMNKIMKTLKLKRR